MSNQKKVSSISAPNEFGSGGRGGGGDFEMEQRGPSFKHTVCALAVSLPWR